MVLVILLSCCTACCRRAQGSNQPVMVAPPVMAAPPVAGVQRDVGNVKYNGHQMGVSG